MYYLCVFGEYINPGNDVFLNWSTNVALKVAVELIRKTFKFP